MIRDKKQGGFSLVELLIVVAIIILLATISVIALNDQRAKARDAKRTSDVRQIRTALEFYHSDEDQYPVFDNPIVLGQKGGEKLCAKSAGAIVSLETPCSQDTTYMAIIPKDPLPDRQYIYKGNIKDYEIIFTTEKPSGLGEAGQYIATAEGINIK